MTDKLESSEEHIKVIRTRTRPKVTVGETTKIKMGCGSMYVTVNEDEKGICEVFITVGKSGGCVASQCAGLSNLISLALRSNIQIDKIVDQLSGIRCPEPSIEDEETVLSCADGIAKVLDAYFKRKKKEIEKGDK